ncbi:MAG: MBL fold metallo-hydrolase [Chlamydiae bacterium]|nr:MBL fold metallo-hydrolase [Chlamydiota bacterium]
MLIIDKILGPIETRTILLVCSKTHEAVLIDPSFYSFRVFSSLIQEKSYKIQKILLTHSHYDHIVDMAKFYNLGIPLYVHPLDKKNVIAPGSDGLRSFKTIEAVSDPQFFQEGDKILFGEVEGVVLETPGHSPGSVSFYFEKENVLITGDTLFKGGIGRLDLPTAVPEKMAGSLEKLKKLPPETIVYPGHGPKTTIGEEL